MIPPGRMCSMQLNVTKKAGAAERVSLAAWVWRVMTVSAVSLVLGLVLIVAWMLLLQQLGIISLEEESGR